MFSELLHKKTKQKKKNMKNTFYIKCIKKNICLWWMVLETQWRWSHKFTHAPFQISETMHETFTKIMLCVFREENNISPPAHIVEIFYL